MELKGKDFMFYVDSKPVACATSGTLSFSNEVKAATKPPGSKWSSFYVSEVGYEISVEGLISIDDDTISSDDLLDKMMSGSELIWVASDVNAPKYYFTGRLNQSSLVNTSPVDGFHTFSMSGTGSGKIKSNNEGLGIYGIEYVGQYE